MSPNLDARGQPLTAPTHCSERRFAASSFVSTDRYVESTYYDPQIKEKLLSDGTTTYGVYGTIGRNNIQHPRLTIAQTVAMLLLQSAVSDGKRFLTLDVKDMISICLSTFPNICAFHANSCPNIFSTPAIP